MPLSFRGRRLLSLLVVAAWVVTMAAVVQQAYLQSSSLNLATDLARYGPTAVWRGVYYRGEKVGFTVSQTTRSEDGFTLEEDGRLQMTLLGSPSAATIHTRADVDAAFVLRAFEFSLDPGTGATTVAGRVQQPVPGTYRLALAITSGGITRSEERDLPEAPVMSLNLSRLLADGRLVPGSRHQFSVLDPATLTSAQVIVSVGSRTIVRAGDSSVPAFRVDLNYRGLRTTSWVTDTGEVMREESPLGLMTVRESAERAQGMGISDRVQSDILKAAAIVPVMRQRIDDARDVRRVRIRLEGADLAGFELDGGNQRVEGNVVELRDMSAVTATVPHDAGDEVAAAQRYLAAETLIESDAPEIRDEARRAVGDATTGAAKAERLTRYVNALLEKKPTVSLPSAREVLRTKVGDCNEHTALYVAMARAAGIPARVAVGLVYIHGAFYYHAWPEVFVDERWLPVDPTLNQFPADATHLRLLRGGLDRQAAILPLIGTLKMTVVDLELAPGAERILVGQSMTGDSSGPDGVVDAALALPAATPAVTSARRCWCFGFGGRQ
jgi:transglutaminase-like putative cysteine protease